MFKIDELQIVTGIDIACPELKLTFRQPYVEEIAMLGETDYLLALSMFRVNKERLKIIHPDITDWDVFKQTLSQPIRDVPNLQVLLFNFLQLFLSERISLGPRSIILTRKLPDGGFEILNIEPEQFPLFQDIICQLGGVSLLKEAGGDDFNPASKLAAEIAEKMKKARAKLAAQRPHSKSKSFLSKYMQALAIQTANSLHDLKKMTILQLDILMKRYLAWEGFEMQVRNRLAGSKNDEKIVHHWMESDGTESNSPSPGSIPESGTLTIEPR